MRTPYRPYDLFDRVTVAQRATVPAGAVFHHQGRALRVHRLYGTDARAPVIVEELAQFGTTMRGQYALWSYEAVERAAAGQTPCR